MYFTGNVDYGNKMSLNFRYKEMMVNSFVFGFDMRFRHSRGDHALYPTQPFVKIPNELIKQLLLLLIFSEEFGS